MGHYASQTQLKEVARKIDGDFARKNGTYTKLSAGNLVDEKATPVSREFTYDTACGTASIADDGTAIIKKINGNTHVYNQLIDESKLINAKENVYSKQLVNENHHYASEKDAIVKSFGGKSVVWNQHVVNGNFADTTGAGWVLNNQNRPVTISGGVATVRVASLGGGTYYDDQLQLSSTSAPTFPSGHKAYVRVDVNFPVECGVSGYMFGTRYFGNTVPANTWTRASKIISCDGSGFSYICGSVTPEVNSEWKYRDIICVDLTQLYGAGNEPSTTDDPRIAAIEAYAMAHPEFNDGTIVNADVVSVDTVGKNLYNASEHPLVNGKYIGGFNGNAGNNAETSATLTFIPCKGFGTITLNKRPGGVNPGIAFYDNDKNFISCVINNSATAGQPWTITVPDEAVFMNFTTVANATDVQIEKGSTATAYAPYHAEQHSIPSAVLTQYPLRSAGSVYDTISFDGQKWLHTKRVGLFDCDAVTWVGGAVGICAPLTGGVANNSVAFQQTSKYESVRFNALGIYPNMIALRENNYLYYNGTTAPTGIVQFELGTPIITDITDLMEDWDGSIEIEEGGTLTFTQEDTQFAIPTSVDYPYADWDEPLVNGQKYLFRDNGTDQNLIAATSGQTISVVGAEDKLINVTHMFGNGNEPASWSDLYTMYPKMAGDIPYNAGEIVNYNGEEIETVGFNAIPTGAWHQGSVNGSTGVPIPSAIPTSNTYTDMFKVIHGQTYIVYPRSSSTFAFIYLDEYDENETFIKHTNYINNSQNGVVLDNRTSYVRLWTYRDGNVILPEECEATACFHLRWSGYRDNDYEPYWKRNLALPISTLQRNATTAYIVTGGIEFTSGWLSLTEGGTAMTPVTGTCYIVKTAGTYLGKTYKWTGTAYVEDANLIFPYGMLSAGTVRDELYDDHAVIKVGVVDLGGISWGKSETNISGKYRMVSSDLENTVKPTPNESVANCVLAMLITKSTNAVFLGNEGVSIGRYGTIQIYIDDMTTMMTAQEFKDAMSGVMLYYELATPITVTFDDNTETGSANQTTPLDFAYPVADFGTEESLPRNDDIVPVTTPLSAEIAYSTDFTRQIANMSKNYTSQDTLDQLLAAIGSATGHTFTKTWDSANERWTFSVT